MAFNVTLETIDDKIVKIALAGELDASVAPLFREQIEKVVAASAQKLVLVLTELSYMSSAGLRILIFAKQKMGAQADVFIVGAQPSILETLEMAGFDKSVILLNEYDAVQIGG
jgi:anti-anti-sigma factor